MFRQRMLFWIMRFVGFKICVSRLTCGPVTHEVFYYFFPLDTMRDQHHKIVPPSSNVSRLPFFGSFYATTYLFSSTCLRPVSVDFNAQIVWLSTNIHLQSFNRSCPWHFAYRKSQNIKENIFCILQCVFFHLKLQSIY